jgi:hypothetical protein
MIPSRWFLFTALAPCVVGCTSIEPIAATIAHNSSLSQGKMWDTADDPTQRDYMARYQTLVDGGADDHRARMDLADLRHAVIAHG